MLATPQWYKGGNFHYVFPLRTAPGFHNSNHFLTPKIIPIFKILQIGTSTIEFIEGFFKLFLFNFSILGRSIDSAYASPIYFLPIADNCHNVQLIKGHMQAS